MSDTYISLTNWEKHQHYKDRHPGWIKLHYSLLASPGWVQGDGDQKALMCGLILLASRFDNHIPFLGPNFVLSSLQLRRKGVSSSSFLRRFLALESCGFIEIHGKMLDQRREENINLEEKKEPSCQNSGKTSSDEELNESLFPEEETPKANPPVVEESPTPKARSTAKPSHEAEKLAALLSGEIRRNAPDYRITPAKQRKWADVADRMLRLDHKSYDEIAGMIVWVQRDEFWRANVLSMQKLREKFDDLKIRRARESKPRASKANPGFEDHIAEILASEKIQ
jgi:hypothetical protein